MKTMQEKLDEAMAVFEGKTPDEVAEIVRGELKGKKAVCGNPHSCAIALYLTRKMKLRANRHFVSVGVPNAEVYRQVDGPIRYYQSPVADAVVPDGAQNFIYRFDDGEYPDLATEDSLASVLEDLAASY